MESLLQDPDAPIQMNTRMIKRFSPDTLSVMEFKSKQDYQIAEKIYDDWPIVGETLQDTWNLRFGAEFHMTNDRHLFSKRQV